MLSIMISLFYLNKKSERSYPSDTVSLDEVVPHEMSQAELSPEEMSTHVKKTLP